MTNVIVPREIIVERVVRPEGWFLVIMEDGAGNELYSGVWECRELALADAEDLKRTYGPAVIREATR
ncbi:hypothetical protein LHFGNBLO_004405 [Mesorhizobium sp. AR10]|uniref:hypothetical protein n=1 Tax=Mesorhizobium sp. AR10 TaxID=2865839 RepID=UPI00215FC5A9|nr:hypothetical protein [Mesorhizobium sp. AR10]UVK37382.1 hypothetical protein LHFGNBLO_004405 [Mesorhizobium sp. AR10]